jgi:hypothetical protein
MCQGLRVRFTLNGVSTSLSQVAAVDAGTGKTGWVYEPETWKNGTPSNNGFVHRGVADWADGEDRRILFGTGDGYLICLSAQSGKPIPTFGPDGRLDLTQGLGRAVDRRLYSGGLHRSAEGEHEPLPDAYSTEVGVPSCLRGVAPSTSSVTAFADSQADLFWRTVRRSDKI